MKTSKFSSMYFSKNTKTKSAIILLSLLIVMIVIFAYFTYVVNPVIVSTSEVKVKSLATKAVNSAIAEVVSESVLYNDLVNIHTNEEGDISLITANSILVNKLSKELAKNAQSKLDLIGSNGFEVAIGTFSGVPILVGRGPNVKLRLLPIGSISCNFKSSFETAGINQTHHRIYVNIESNVSVILPSKNKSVKTVTEVMICESIIVGKIPQTYLNSSNIQDMLDLIP